MIRGQNPSFAAPLATTVFVVDSSVASSSYGNGLRYVPVRHGQSDSIVFQFIASATGVARLGIVYAMSSAAAAGVRLRVDVGQFGAGDAPTGSLSTGTAFTVTTPNDVNLHEITSSQSSDLAISVTAGKIVVVQVNRLGSDAADTHAGDLRALLRVT